VSTDEGTDFLVKFKARPVQGFPDSVTAPRGEVIARVVLVGCLVGLMLLFGVLMAGVFAFRERDESTRITVDQVADQKVKPTIKLEQITPADSSPLTSMAPDSAKASPIKPAPLEPAEVEPAPVKPSPVGPFPARPSPARQRPAEHSMDASPPVVVDVSARRENSRNERDDARTADFDAVRSLLAEAEAAAIKPASESADSRTAAVTVDRELAQLSASIRFPRRSWTVDAGMQAVLERVDTALESNPDAPVQIRVATSEYATAARNRQLALERGRAIIAELVTRGSALSRFSIDALDQGDPSSDALRRGDHRVIIGFAGQDPE